MKGKYLNLTPGRLLMMEWKAKEAKTDIKEGRMSFSKETPLLVSYFPDLRKYLIRDGHHRAMELLAEGKKQFYCQISEHEPRIYKVEYPLITLKQSASITT